MIIKGIIISSHFEICFLFLYYISMVSLNTLGGCAAQLEFSNGTDICQKGSSFRRCGEAAAARYSSKRLSNRGKKKDFFVGTQKGSLHLVLSVITRHRAGPFITRRNVDILRAKRRVRCGLEESHMMDSMKAEFTSQKIHD